MTIEEVAELFLARLYDLAEAAPHPNFLFTVNDFAPMLGVTDREKLQEAINILGDRGLIISATLDMLGGISAAITMEGSVFVEEGGKTGIIGRYRKDPGAFLASLPPREPPAAPLPEKEAVADAFAPSRAVLAILSDMADILEKDPSVGGDERKDAIADLAALRIQLGRTVKKSHVIDALLDDLCRIPSIAPLAAGLRSIVAGFGKAKGSSR